jgi:hypothetical protein
MWHPRLRGDGANQFFGRELQAAEVQRLFSAHFIDNSFCWRIDGGKRDWITKRDVPSPKALE